MTKKLKKGDQVSWQSAQGKVDGKILKKVTAPLEIKGHHVAASKDNPEYLVKSDKTGATAAHKADALTESADTGESHATKGN